MTIQLLADPVEWPIGVTHREARFPLIREQQIEAPKIQEIAPAAIAHLRVRDAQDAIRQRRQQCRQ